MPGLLAAVDPQLVAACGPKGRQSWLCSTVYRISGSQDAAEVADTLAKPVRIAFILVLAAIAAWVLRRVVRRMAHRLLDPQSADAMRRRTGRPGLAEAERRRRTQRAATVASVLRNIVSVFVWAIAFLLILGELGIDLAPLLAGAGVVTVVIGFGAQTVVRDFLAGLFMVLEDQYGVGDVIEVDGVSGTVEWLSLRVTRFRDVEGVVWWVPNGEFRRVGNKSQQWSRALLDISLAYDTDVDAATEVMQRTADELWHDQEWRPAVLAEPEVWGLENVSESGLVLRLVVKTVPLEQWRVARELRKRLKAAFDGAGIDMAIPQQRITYQSGEAPPYDAAAPHDAT